MVGWPWADGYYNTNLAMIEWNNLSFDKNICLSVPIMIEHDLNGFLAENLFINKKHIYLQWDSDIVLRRKYSKRA